LDPEGTPELAGRMVVPAGPDIHPTDATAAAERLVAAHEVAETYASVLQGSNRGSAAEPTETVQSEPSAELMEPAQVQTDISELVLGGEGTQKVRVPLPQRGASSGTPFDFKQDDLMEAKTSWRTNREIEREQQFRENMDRIHGAKAKPTGQHASVSADTAPKSQSDSIAAQPLHQAPTPAENATSPPTEPAEPEVIDVEPVVLGSATYLVDKQSGMVYSNVLQPGKEPVVVGRWNAKREKGSFEEHSSGQRQTATVDTQLDSVPEQSTRAKRADGEPGDKEAAPAVRFAAHAQVDAGAVPTVKSDFGKLPTTDGTEAVPPGQNVAPPVSVIPTSEQLKQRGERAHGDKPLQWLAGSSQNVFQNLFAKH